MSESKPTLEEDIERVLARMESGNGYRSSPQLSPQLVQRLRGQLDRLYSANALSGDELLLSERIKAIYPVIHRAYDMFDRTKQIDKNVDTFQVGEKTATLEVLDSRYSNAYADCGVMVRMILDGENLYHISRLHPSWKRKNLEYDNYEVKKRSCWEWISPQDKCVTIRSSYFKID